VAKIRNSSSLGAKQCSILPSKFVGLGQRLVQTCDPTSDLMIRFTPLTIIVDANEASLKRGASTKIAGTKVSIGSMSQV